MVFRKRYRYRFGDIDHAGIAYYPSLLHYFHCAFEDWWAEGLGRDYPAIMREERFGLPAVHIDADFFAPIRYGDEPEICIGVLRVGRTSVELGFWMQVGDGDRPACRARITTVSVDLDSMAKRPVPDDVRERLARFALDEADYPGG